MFNSQRSSCFVNSELRGGWLRFDPVQALVVEGDLGLDFGACSVRFEFVLHMVLHEFNIIARDLLALIADTLDEKWELLLVLFDSNNVDTEVNGGTDK